MKSVVEFRNRNTIAIITYRSFATSEVHAVNCEQIKLYDMTIANYSNC